MAGRIFNQCRNRLFARFKRAKHICQLAGCRNGNIVTMFAAQQAGEATYLDTVHVARGFRNSTACQADNKARFYTIPEQIGDGNIHRMAEISLIWSTARRDAPCAEKPLRWCRSR